MKKPTADMKCAKVWRVGGWLRGGHGAAIQGGGQEDQYTGKQL